MVPLVTVQKSDPSTGSRRGRWLQHARAFVRSVRCNFEKNSVLAGRWSCLRGIGLCTEATCCCGGTQSCCFCGSSCTRSPCCCHADHHRSCGQARGHACGGRSGCRRHRGSGVGERQGLSLRERQVLRQDQAWLVHVRSRCEGQGRTRRPWQGMLIFGATDRIAQKPASCGLFLRPLNASPLRTWQSHRRHTDRVVSATSKPTNGGHRSQRLAPLQPWTGACFNLKSIQRSSQ